MAYPSCLGLSSLILSKLGEGLLLKMIFLLTIPLIVISFSFYDSISDSVYRKFYSSLSASIPSTSIVPISIRYIFLPFSIFSSLSRVPRLTSDRLSP